MSVKRTSTDLSDMQLGLGIGCTVAISLMIISWGCIIKELYELCCDIIQLTPHVPPQPPTQVPLQPVRIPPQPPPYIPPQPPTQVPLQPVRVPPQPPPYVPALPPVIAPRSNVTSPASLSNTSDNDEPPPPYESICPVPSGNISYAGYNRPSSIATVPLPEVIVAGSICSPTVPITCAGTQQ